MPRAWTILLAVILSGTSLADDQLKVATAAWGEVLTKYVKGNGGVDYVGLSQEPKALAAVLAAYATLDLREANDATKKAALINLYNAGMMHNLLRYARDAGIAVASREFLQLEIVDISVPGGNIWNGSYKVKLGGFDLTLDDIEHGLIRGAAKVDTKLDRMKVSKLDPRIHAAVNCAAISCPRVRESPYTAVAIDRMLDENMREFVSSEAQFAKLNDRLMRANKIVSWYYADFDEPQGAGNFLAGFLTATAKDKEWKIKHFQEHLNHRNAWLLKVSRTIDFHYDWRVNDTRNKP